MACKLGGEQVTAQEVDIFVRGYGRQDKTHRQMVSRLALGCRKEMVATMEALALYGEPVLQRNFHPSAHPADSQIPSHSHRCVSHKPNADDSQYRHGLAVDQLLARDYLIRWP